MTATLPNSPAMLVRNTPAQIVSKAAQAKGAARHKTKPASNNQWCNGNVSFPVSVERRMQQRQRVR